MKGVAISSTFIAQDFCRLMGHGLCYYLGTGSLPVPRSIAARIFDRPQLILRNVTAYLCTTCGQHVYSFGTPMGGSN